MATFLMCPPVAILFIIFTKRPGFPERLFLVFQPAGAASFWAATRYDQAFDHGLARRSRVMQFSLRSQVLKD